MSAEKGKSGWGGESEPERLSGYEGDRFLPYAELGKGENFDNWGSVMVTNENGDRECRSFYSDPKVTERLFSNPIMARVGNKDGEAILADFGGGDGIMLGQVKDQLSEAGLKTQPLLLDLDEKKLQQASQERPDIKPLVCDLAKIPLPENSIDIGVSRMTMQYFPRPFDRDEPLPKWMPRNNRVVVEKFEKDGYINQFDVLKEMHRVLKPGSSLVLVWPGAYKYTSKEDKKRADNISYFWNRVTADREYAKPDDKAFALDESFVSLDRWFTAGEEMADFAEKAGFDVEEGGEMDWIEFRMTAKAVCGRFDPDETWPEIAREVIDEDFQTVDSSYQKSKKTDRTEGLEITKWHDKKAVRLPICRLVLKKPE